MLLFGAVVVGPFSCRALSWMLIPYFSHPWEILWTGKEETSSAVPAARRKTNQAVIQASNVTVVKYIFFFFGRNTRSFGKSFLRAGAVTAGQLLRASHTAEVVGLLRSSAFSCKQTTVQLWKSCLD